MVEHSDAYTLNSTRPDGDALHHDPAVVNGPAVYYAGGGGSKRPGRLLRQFGPMFTAVVNGPAVYYTGGGGGGGGGGGSKRSGRLIPPPRAV